MWWALGIVVVLEVGHTARVWITDRRRGRPDQHEGARPLRLAHEPRPAPAVEKHP